MLDLFSQRMRSQYFFKDFSASIVVFLVALPLCMGVAMASGATVIQGILSGIIGGIVVGAISGSSVSVSGPAAGLIIVVETALADLDKITPGQAFGMFALAVFIAGLVQILLGILKLGSIADFIPVSVIKGMLAAIGIILILKEIPHLIGYDRDPIGEQEFLQKDGHNTFSELYFSLKNITPLAFIIGILGLVVQFIWEKPFVKKSWVSMIFPAPLIVVFLGVSFNEIAKHWYPDYAIVGAEHMVQVPVFSEDGSIIKAFNSLGSMLVMPKWSSFTEFGIWKVAFVIAIIASVESLLSLEAGDKLDKGSKDSAPNRELVAQGVGNVFAGLVGALPITAVIVRTSANIQAGAKSKLSAMMHGLWLLIFVLFAPTIINLIPLSALAAVLTYVGYKLAKPSLFKEQHARGNAALIPFVVTIIAILLTDLLIGVTIGLVLGFYFVLKTNFHRAFTVVHNENSTMIRFNSQATFLNKSLLKKHLLDLESSDSSVIFDLSNCTFIDNDITDIIADFVEHGKNIKLHVDFKYSNETQKNKFEKQLALN